MWLDLLLIVVGTFLSEDVTTLSVGLAVQQGRVGLVAGMTACMLGIFVGDLGLWVLGRLAGDLPLVRRWFARRLSQSRVDDFLAWFDAHAGRAIFGTRLVPGSRLPLYVAAGFARASFGRFAAWTLLAAAIWTPVVVLAAGGAAVAWPARQAMGSAWVARAMAVASLAVVWKVGARLASRSVPYRAWAAVSRLWRWEFWPGWLFYFPVAAWVLVLAVRYRGLQTMTAANPGIADGGVVGESKHEILQKLPAEWTIPGALVTPGAAPLRMARLENTMSQRGWRFPVILKPDVGQRGAGVRLVTDASAARSYLDSHAGAVLVQPYHEGPYEVGIFYYRPPDRPTGHILSITDKEFPVIVGDGRSTLERLIWRHPRYRMQAAKFLGRHAAQRARVLADGERLRLAVAGNHAQGTLFRDGSHLLTPALAARIDEIGRSVDGFFVGRFDIRYRDPERFARGLDLAIVELNGATAESTNIYDPSGSLWQAYATLFRQWAVVFAIGAANRRRGLRPTSFSRLARLVGAHLATRPPFPVSD